MREPDLSLRLLASLLVASAALACTPESDGAQEGGLSELARQGEQVYQDVCIACHNGNPNVDGALGPSIAGASVTLLEARVLRGEYPPDYTPKRPQGNAMPRFPYLEGQIPALAAYLAEVKTPDAAAGDGAAGR